MKNGDTMLTFYNISDSQLREINAQLSADSELTAVKQELEQLKKELKSVQEKHAETLRRLEEQSETKLSERSVTPSAPDLSIISKTPNEEKSKLVPEKKEEIKAAPAKKDPAINKVKTGDIVTIFIMLAVYIGLVFLRQSWSDYYTSEYKYVSIFLSVIPLIIFIGLSIISDDPNTNKWIEIIRFIFPAVTLISNTIILFGFPLAPYSSRGVCCGITFVLIAAALFRLLFWLFDEVLFDEDIAYNIMAIVSLVSTAALLITSDLAVRELYVDDWFFGISFSGTGIIGLIIGTGADENDLSLGKVASAITVVASSFLVLIAGTE